MPLIIDVHAHAGLNWFSPVETLLNEMNLCGVSHAVLVQHKGSYDNSYLFECARRYPRRFKVVVDVDPDDEYPEELLEQYKKLGAAGVRYRPYSEYRSHDRYSMWRVAGELGLVVSVGTTGGAESLGTDFKRILDACPDTHVQIEHLCGAGLDRPPYKAFYTALECAEWPNTSVKVPGLGEILERPDRLPKEFPFTEYPDVYQAALQAFGPQRMCWGSDFPPCARREGYRNCLNGVRQHPAFRDPEVLDWITGKAAARIWGFDDAS
jgi:L-fuconolactonase